MSSSSTDAKAQEITDNNAGDSAPTISLPQLSEPSTSTAPTIDDPPNTDDCASSFSFFDGNGNNQMNLDGALYRILEYLTPSDFYILGALVGSRYWKRLLFEDPRTDYLFAPPGPRGMITKDGRKRLRNIRLLRQAVEGIRENSSSNNTNGPKQRKRKGGSKPQKKQPMPLNRVGVLPSEEEDAILRNDTNGYFGASFFRPGVLAVWGDYSGIFLTSHVDKLFPSQQQTPESKIDGSNSSTIECETSHREIAEEEKMSPFASAAQTPEPETKKTPATMGKEGCGYLFVDDFQVMAVLFCTPFVFLGFASGTIHSIDTRPIYKDPPQMSPTKDPTATESGKIIEYPHVSECKYHCQTGEISSLTSVEDQHLISSCMKANARTSEILIHWDALVSGDLKTISRIQINEHTFSSNPLNRVRDVSPLALAMTKHDQNVRVLSIGARDQNLAHIHLWNMSNSHNDAVLGKIKNPDGPPPVFRFNSQGPIRYDPILKLYRGKRCRQPTSHHFVYLKYLQEDLQEDVLIVGTSKGDLLKMDLDRPTGFENQDENQEREEWERSNFLYNCCRGGMVEAVELVGKNQPIMITAGGYDGRISFWDWESFASLGSLRTHPGQQALVTESLLAAWTIGRRAAAIPTGRHRYNPVVSTFFCHERSSMVSFCRDGHLHEWKVEDEARKHVANTTTTNENAGRDATATKGSDDEDKRHENHRVRRTRRRTHLFT